MAFRFIHTGDWHLGKPFRNFPDGLAGELAAARFDAITRIAAIAAAEHASHVLVAGDVFDDPNLGRVEILRALDRMASHPGLTWVLLPGNHDPDARGGVWDRVRKLGAPSNVIVVANDAPLAMQPGMAVLAAPLKSKNPGRDPTAWMDAAVTSTGTLRIGLAHGSTQGFGGDGDSSVPIAVDRVSRAGLAYLALGDWHGCKEVSPNVWYAGAPEPDRYLDNDSGFVLSVSVDGPGRVSVARKRCAAFTWIEAAGAVASAADLDAVAAKHLPADAIARQTLLKLGLSGSLSLAEHAALDDRRERLAARVKNLEIDTSRVAVRADASDTSIFAGSKALEETASRLQAIAGDAASPSQRAAALALIRLYGFASEAAREAGP